MQGMFTDLRCSVPFNSAGMSNGCLLIRMVVYGFGRVVKQTSLRSSRKVEGEHLNDKSKLSYRFELYEL